MTTLAQAELLRYSRHLILPDVGVPGQEKLKAARVLLIGAGGLGSPAALYLAAAGVGTLGLVDFDNVDVTNLQRQILHGTKDVGRPKLLSARERIADVNPHVRLAGCCCSSTRAECSAARSTFERTPPVPRVARTKSRRSSITSSAAGCGLRRRSREPSVGSWRSRRASCRAGSRAGRSC